MIYFVRHAESQYIEGQERMRGLTEQGGRDALQVAALLADERIDRFVSSPYERAVQTLEPLAERGSRRIGLYEDLRERRVGRFGAMGFTDAKKRLYADWEFSYPGGESSREAQGRAVKVLYEILDTSAGQGIAIGTHGDVMTLMLNALGGRYGYEFWRSTSMPDIYRIELKERKLVRLTRLWDCGSGRA